MRPHPYLRAYMAGIAVPTLILLLTMTVFACFHFYFEVPSQFVLAMPAWPLARAIMFPMAVVPNVWGLWNMLYLALRSRVRLPLGLHGALLPLFLIPGGVALARVFDSLRRHSHPAQSAGSSDKPRLETAERAIRMHPGRPARTA